MCLKCKHDINFDELNQYIINLCNELDIVILDKKFKSETGMAWVSERRIKIPIIKSISGFIVALHEIGHIINSEPITVPDYIIEYNADMWAINHLEKLIGYVCDDYIRRSKWYILYHIAEYHNSNGYQSKIPKKIKDYVDENVSNWNNYQIAVSFNKNYINILKKIKIK